MLSIFQVFGCLALNTNTCRKRDLWKFPSFGVLCAHPVSLPKCNKRKLRLFWTTTVKIGKGTKTPPFAPKGLKVLPTAIMADWKVRSPTFRLC